MPRSSRHKSHRPHKHKERSDSEEEESPRGRKQRDAPAGSGSGARVSWDPEPEKVKPSHERDGIGAGNDDSPGENGKKRKDRPVDVSGVADRWNGDAYNRHADEKELKVEDFGSFDAEKMEKSKLSASESKSKSSRRRDGSVERKEERGVREESTKRRLEKESSRKESSSQYVNVKEGDREHGSSRDRENAPERDKGRVSEKDRAREMEKDRERGLEKDRERGSEKDRDFQRRSKRDREHGLDIERERASEREKVTDSRRERFSDVANRNSQMGSTEEEYFVKVDVENTEWTAQDELYKPSLEKELEKHIRKRENSSQKDKWQGDGGDSDDRILTCTDDHGRSSSYKDEKYREKYEDFGRDQRHRDDKNRDDRSPRHHVSERSEIKHCRDENKHSENRNKSRLQDNDHERSPYVDEHSMGYKDNGERKRSSVENEEYGDLKPRNAKVHRPFVETNSSNNNKQDSSNDKDRPESIHSSKVDSTPSRNQPRSSPSSAFQTVKDEYRHNSVQTESTCRRSLSKERHHTSSASSGDLAGVSRTVERVLKSRSVESRASLKDVHLDDLLVEDATQRTPRSDAHASPIQLTERMTPTSDRHYSSRKIARRSSDVDEMGQKISYSKDRREYSTNEEREREGKLSMDDNSQMELPNRGPTRSGSASYNRTDHFSGSSPGHLPPPPPVRHGIDSPSVLGSFEDINRVQAGDRKSNSRYKRSGDPNLGRGQGNAWKGVPNWPSPVANGFIPFQHGPPPGGFHPVLQQFPSPSMFGVRPFMDLNHAAVPFHMHESADRFSTHSLPFGWRNPSDEPCPPHFQGWDGNNAVFGDDAHMYGRPDWEQNRHLISSRSWEMNSDSLKEQNGSLNTEFLASQQATSFPNDETHSEQSGHQHSNEKLQLEHTETKQSSDIHVKQSINNLEKNATETFPKIKHEKQHTPSKLSNTDGVKLSATCLYKLDISCDLARPELYGQCRNIVGTEGEPALGSDGVTLVNAQETNACIKMAVRSSRRAGRSLFPPVTDDVFKKAISVYKKLNDRSKTKITSSLFQPIEEKHPPITLDDEKIETVENHAFPEDNLLADAKSPVEEDGNDASGLKGDIVSDAQDMQSDTIPSAVAFAEESSQGCEGLKPECLSRNLNSPKSTH